jgi:hypothetical protein
MTMPPVFATPTPDAPETGLRMVYEDDNGVLAGLYLRRTFPQPAYTTQSPA